VSPPLRGPRQRQSTSAVSPPAVSATLFAPERRVAPPPGAQFSPYGGRGGDTPPVAGPAASPATRHLPNEDSVARETQPVRRAATATLCGSGVEGGGAGSGTPQPMHMTGSPPTSRRSRRGTQGAAAATRTVTGYHNLWLSSLSDCKGGQAVR